MASILVPPRSTPIRIAAIGGHSSHGEFVRRVQRRDLVALGQRRIVEHGREEIIEPRTEADDSLADVNELRRTGPDDVHPEETPIVSMKQHLEETAVVPEDLAAGDL